MQPGAAAAKAHQASRQALVAVAAAAAAQEWSGLDVDALAASWRVGAARLAVTIAGAQTAAAQAAQPYVAQMLAAQGAAAAASWELAADAFAWAAADGRDLLSLLYEPVITALLGIRGGRGLAESLAAGLRQLDTITRTEVADAGRVADGVALTAEPAAHGYVRLVVGRTCARCIILAGRVYRWSDGFQRHPRCDCVHIPARQAYAAGLLQNPQAIYESMTAQERSRAGWSRAEQQAIADGADIGQVTNIHRRGALYTAGGRRHTKEGTTRRGLFGGYAVDPATGQLRRRARGERPPDRLTPESIYQIAGDRDEAVRLLREHGYLRGEPSSNAPSPARGHGHATSAAAGPPDLGKMTVAQLRAEAKRRGVTVSSRARKAEIVALLQGGLPPAGKKAQIPEDLTVAQLRKLARDNGVRLPSGLRKADIIAHIRFWEIGNSRRILPGPLRRNPKVVTGLHKRWWTVLPDDTGMTPVPVRRLKIPVGAHTYTVTSGSIYRINRVTYLVEDGPGAHTPRFIVEEFLDVHTGVPASAAQYQRGYAWLMGPNPEDAHWERRYGMPGFTSFASAGSGETTVWGRAVRGGTPRQFRPDLLHELGHNTSTGVVPQGLHAEGQLWISAGAADAVPTRVTIISYRSGLGHHLLQPQPDPAARYPNGVTGYGKKSVVEDFADSVMFYLAGPLGRAVLTPGGPEVDVYFRDLFPHRAAHLDRVFPEVGIAQRAALARRGV